jgi:competence protein CoiA
VARAAAEAGWDVTLERPAEDRSWIADVLVEKNGRRLAIEIQWSKQDVSEFAFRQERYAAAGIECFWFVHRRNKLAAEDAGVPYLVFDGDGLPLDVRAREAFQEEELAPLAGVVKLILDGGYLDRVQAKATAVTFELAEMSCFACHRDSTVWRIESVAVRTRCQQTTAFEAPGYSLWAKERVEAGLYEIARASIAGVAPLAPLRSHYSKTAKSAYLAYGCAHCARGFFGDFFVGNNYDWDEVTIPVTVRIPLSQELLTHRHVCLDNGFGRCSQDAQHHDGPAFGDHGNTEYEDGVDTISMAEILDKMTGRGYRWR